MLTPSEREELDALQDMNDATGKASFLMRFHWRGDYQSLVQRGLVKWGKPPIGFNPRLFAGVRITRAGRRALADKETT